MGILNGIEMTFSYIAHSIFRFIQFVMALAVSGLYGVDLHAANKQHKYSDGKWVCFSFLYLRPLLAIYFKCSLTSTGLRRSNRRLGSLHSSPLHYPLHLAHPLRLRLGHYHIHPLDRPLWSLWLALHQGGCAG